MPKRLSLVKKIISLFGAVFLSGTSGIFSPVFSAPPAKAFGQLPMAYDAAISPNGDLLAAIINIRGEYAVVVQPTEGKGMKPKIAPLGEGITPGYIKWINNDRWAVSIKRQQTFRGTPFTSSFLYSYDLKTDDQGLIVHPKKMFRQFNDRVIDWLEDDPDHILMTYSEVEWDSYPDIEKSECEYGAS